MILYLLFKKTLNSLIKIYIKIIFFFLNFISLSFHGIIIRHIYNNKRGFLSKYIHLYVQKIHTHMHARTHTPIYFF